MIVNPYYKNIIITKSFKQTRRSVYSRAYGAGQATDAVVSPQKTLPRVNLLSASGPSTVCGLAILTTEGEHPLSGLWILWKSEPIDLLP